VYVSELPLRVRFFFRGACPDQVAAPRHALPLAPLAPPPFREPPPRRCFSASRDARGAALSAAASRFPMFFIQPRGILFDRKWGKCLFCCEIYIECVRAPPCFLPALTKTLSAALSGKKTERLYRKILTAKRVLWGTELA
jgi:hypothetical protein